MRSSQTFEAEANAILMPEKKTVHLNWISHKGGAAKLYALHV